MLEDTRADANKKEVEFVVIERVGETKECATNLRVQLPSIFASALVSSSISLVTTGVPFSFQLEWRDGTQKLLSLSSSLALISLSYCGNASVHCGSSDFLSGTSCTTSSVSGSSLVTGFIVRGDATLNCRLSFTVLENLNQVFAVQDFEVRASRLIVDGFPSIVRVGHQYSFIASARDDYFARLFSLYGVAVNFELNSCGLGSFDSCGSAMISADRKRCSSMLHGGTFFFLDFILRDQVSESCSFSISIYQNSASQILLPFTSTTEANKVSLSQFPAFSLTGNPGFNFQVSWLDHHGLVMSFFQTHIIDISLSNCGVAHFANCGSNLSATSSVSCSGTSLSGIIGIAGMTIRGDATLACMITGTTRGYSSPISDLFTIELRAAVLQVNLDFFPSTIFLGSPFSISYVVQDDLHIKLGSLSSAPISMDLTHCQHSVFMQSCLSPELASSGVLRCGVKSFLGIASHNNISVVSDTGFFPAGSSRCTFSWKMYGQEFFSTSISIIERVMFTSSPASVSFPNSQEVFIFGNSFLASQISLKIYDVTRIMSEFDMFSCSSTNFSRRDGKLQVLLKTLSPITEITDIYVRNKTLISFVLDSARVLPGFKVITAQADSQIFHQQLCLNVTEHEHLTQSKLNGIIAAHKENARSPFIEHLHLNQQQIFSDIENVVSDIRKYLLLI